MTCPRCTVEPCACVTCVICGFTGHGGLGYWACHFDDDVTPVCRGKCWRKYSEAKEITKDIQEALK